MAFRARIILKGQKQLINQLKRRTGSAFDRVKNVQNATARDILRDAQGVVPRDSNALANSARIQEDRATRRSLRTLGVTYDEEYAMEQHEDLEAKHDPGQEAKFLEKPAKRQRRRYAIELRQAMKGGLE